MSKLYIGREFEQAAGDGEGQGSLACCRSWDHKELDMTEQLTSHTYSAYKLNKQGDNIQP